MERQAAKRIGLLRDLKHKLQYPPIRSTPFPAEKGDAAPVEAPQPTNYNTRPRARQLSALMVDGAMVLDLLNDPEGGGLGALLKTKKVKEIDSGGGEGKKDGHDGDEGHQHTGMAAKTSLGDHVSLCAGRPWGGIKEVVLAAAKYGSGLQGLSPNEAVETFWTYCAERIQSVWRGKKSRKTLGGAMRMW